MMKRGRGGRGRGGPDSTTDEPGKGSANPACPSPLSGTSHPSRAGCRHRLTGQLAKVVGASRGAMRVIAGSRGGGTLGRVSPESSVSSSASHFSSRPRPREPPLARRLFPEPSAPQAPPSLTAIDSRREMGTPCHGETGPTGWEHGIGDPPAPPAFPRRAHLHLHRPPGFPAGRPVPDSSLCLMTVDSPLSIPPPLRLGHLPAPLSFVRRPSPRAPPGPDDIPRPDSSPRT